MFNSIVQKLNKSFGSSNHDDSDNPKMSPKKRAFSNPDPNANIIHENVSPSKTDICSSVSDSKKPPVKKKKPCNLCKGAGCCVRCDMDDEWDNMLYCTNKSERKHLIHHSCDNLTPELIKHINQYYCPNCRSEGKFQVTFYKKTSSSKKKEIEEILNIKKGEEIEILPNSTEAVDNTTCKKAKDSQALTSKDVNLECPSKDCSNQINLENPSKTPSNLTLVQPVVPYPDSPPAKDLEGVQVSQALDNANDVDETGNTKESQESRSHKVSTLEEVSKGDTLSISSSSDDSLASEEFHKDSFLEAFPGQLPSKNRSISISSKTNSPIDASQPPNNDNPLHESNHGLNSQKNNDHVEFSSIWDVDNDGRSSSQTSSCFSPETQKNIEKEQNFILTIRSLAQKLQESNQEKKELKDIIEGQEKEIMSLQRENFKFELELDEAETVIASTETQLKDLKIKLKFTEEQLSESCKAYLPLNINEMYQFPPHGSL